MDARAVQDDPAAFADPARAAFTAPYLGIVPGGYGEGDMLLGIPVPAQRRGARRARDLPLDEAATLLASPVHEHRFVALVVLVERHRRAGAAERADLSGSLSTTGRAWTTGTWWTPARASSWASGCRRRSARR